MLIVWRRIVLPAELGLDTGFGEDGAVVVWFGALYVCISMYSVWPLRNFPLLRSFTKIPTENISWRD